MTADKLPSVFTVPPPRRGGTGIMCPLVDVAATEQAGDGGLHMCPWHRRRDSARGRAQYRRHWRRDHIAPFIAETGELLRYLAKIEFGARIHRAEITISKAREEEDDAEDQEHARDVRG